jgi:hypothetical protein
MIMRIVDADHENMIIKQMCMYQAMYSEFCNEMVNLEASKREIKFWGGLKKFDSNVS